MNKNLITGEEISFKHLDFHSAATALDDEAINEKYIKGEVRIVTEQARYPLPSIVAMLASADYSLNPEFQRRHRWSNVQKSRLIESFIMNVPIPPIFLYEDRYGHYEVMDGLQRLSAINEFYLNKFPLEGLEQWPELNNKTYTILPSQIKKGIDRRYLSSIILLQETAKNLDDAKKLKQLVFERLNSGGVKLEAQESRNAIYDGPLNMLCIKLARNKYLCQTWDIPEPDIDEIEKNTLSETLLKNEDFRKMEDVELVLRFFANRQRERLIKVSLNFGDFLDNYLRYGNQFNPSVINDLSDIFKKTIKFIYDLMGEKAFWLYRVRNGDKWSWRQTPTVTVYDPLMLVASKYLNEDVKNKILAKSSSIEDIMQNFYKSNYNSFEGRNNNPSILLEREKKFIELFEMLAL